MVARKQIVLSPIEVAIEDIQKKTAEVLSNDLSNDTHVKITMDINRSPKKKNISMFVRYRSQRPRLKNHRMQKCCKWSFRDA